LRLPRAGGVRRAAQAVRHTVQMSAQPLRLETNGAASPEEAAAVVAARAAILEGVERDSEADVSDPWINT
jgi:hypothetical protein